ncbi:MAG: hypothetical protein HQL90_00115 [Magnetococcales bacterium]|nr:hypothetical protein [Magnetococcales bacterium]
METRQSSWPPSRTLRAWASASSGVTLLFKTALDQVRPVRTSVTVPSPLSR